MDGCRAHTGNVCCGHEYYKRPPTAERHTRRPPDDSWPGTPSAGPLCDTQSLPSSPETNLEKSDTKKPPAVFKETLPSAILRRASSRSRRPFILWPVRSAASKKPVDKESRGQESDKGTSEKQCLQTSRAIVCHVVQRLVPTRISRRAARRRARNVKER